MEAQKYIVSSTPHIRAKDTVRDVMLDVLIALLPAFVMAVYFFRIEAVMLTAVAVASSVGFEALYQKLTKQRVSVSDLSAAVTGALLAFNLPASAPLWIPVVGSFFAIVIVKQLFGGIGQNFINPALGARAFMLAAYPVQMTNWTHTGVDAVSSATPLALLKNVSETGFEPGFWDYFNAAVGDIGGCLGETCAAALLLGGLYLIAKRVISWRIPVSYAASMVLFVWFFGRNGRFTGVPFYELMVGGFMLGAFFMATDYTTSPITPMGQIIMGAGCGLLTALIRCFGGYPEGVSYSILLMNLCVPLIDKYTKPRVFGTKKRSFLTGLAKKEEK